MTPDPMTPAERLRELHRAYPDLSRQVDAYRADRGNRHDWPAWCFLPQQAWYAIAAARHGRRELPLNQLAEVSILAALGTWRYSQGIYRPHPAVASALAASPMNAALPAEVLFRLPEWGLYIETPGLEAGGRRLRGFWAHLNFDLATQWPELRLLIHSDGAPPLAIPIRLGDLSLAEALAALAQQALTKPSLDQVGASLSPGAASTAVTQMTAIAEAALPFLLYLCSDQPEILDRKRPDARPGRPRPKRTRQGWRIFPAANPRVWDLGSQTGDRLEREASARDEAQDSDQDGAQDGHQDGKGRSPRGHLRRAHWHGYWTGPRSDNSPAAQDGETPRFIYRWIAPTYVSGREK